MFRSAPKDASVVPPRRRLLPAAREGLGPAAKTGARERRYCARAFGSLEGIITMARNKKKPHILRRCRLEQKLSLKVEKEINCVLLSLFYIHGAEVMSGYYQVRGNSDNLFPKVLLNVSVLGPESPVPRRHELF